MSTRGHLWKVFGLQDNSQANLNIRGRDLTIPPIEVTPKNQQLKQLTWQVSDHLVNYVEGWDQADRDFGSNSNSQTLLVSPLQQLVLGKRPI